MATGGTKRLRGAVLAPAAVGISVVLGGVVGGGVGVASAQDTAPPGSASPGITSIEFDDEDGRPTLEVDYVDLEGEDREVEVDLTTGRILDDDDDNGNGDDGNGNGDDGNGNGNGGDDSVGT